MNYIIRKLREEEVKILDKFLYEAIFIPEGVEAPPMGIINQPELQVYVDGFGTKDGDICFVAETDEVKDVGGVVVEAGKVYDIIFKTCGCPLHTQANVSSGKLCECSRQSMICVFETLVPGRKFNIQKMESILDGNNQCRFRISFEE